MASKTTRDIGKVARHAKNTVKANTHRTGDAVYTAKSAVKDMKGFSKIPVGKSVGVDVKSGRDVRVGSKGTLTSPKPIATRTTKKVDTTANKLNYDRSSASAKKSAAVAKSRLEANIKRQTSKKK